MVRIGSPRVYAVYHINDNFSLKGGVSKAFKAPSIREISESYVTSTEAGAGLFMVIKFKTRN